MKPIHILSAILITAFLVLTGCGLRDNTNQSPPTTLTISTSASIPTHISLTLSPSDQPSQTSTLTPIPTLSKQDALETFVNRIEKNGKCDLPCWLGVTPGQTKFEEVENIFSQFSANASTKFSPHSAYIRVFFPDFETAIHDTVTEVYPAESGKVLRVLVDAAAYQNKNGPLDYNDPEFQRLWKRYFLPGIFTKHGAPEKIFLDTTQVAVDTATSYPFVLWIIYPYQGFLIRYEGHNTKIGENIQICPMQSKIEIKIWDANNSRYKEFLKDNRASGVSTSLGPQPIENVTDFSIKSFYEKFRSSDVNTCFQTPASIWPH